MIKSYLKDSEVFQDYSVYEILEVAGVSVNELTKGLIYTELMNRRAKQKGNGLKNPIGYLLSCFDEKGRFKYNDVHLKKLPNDAPVKTYDSNVEYIISDKNLISLKEYFEAKYPQKTKIFYRKDGQKIFIKKITKAGRPLYPKVWLKKFDIPFEIVTSILDYEETI
ncbi:hypothetical protein MROS_2534 [Melioribacter roseus P3M-2]|uniref:Uncharacterized protein n=1 Tax=Melioribacter roseus (strain DSM 23840 / JCM 17771 / VKM B-2668 / P3M-2) TaxID=1191523 RepID=I6ZUS2_MELRP|nr:hypothetical protein [Melioribacter roseus]AFN75764.1 hypothetical protein MROS_2534 [Melioribacter roseus P3M-2]